MLRVCNFISTVETQVITLSDLASDLELCLRDDLDKSKCASILINFDRKFYELNKICLLSSNLTDCLSKLDPNDEDYDLLPIKELFGDLLERLFNCYIFINSIDAETSTFIVDRIAHVIECVENFLKGFYIQENDACY